MTSSRSEAEFMAVIFAIFPVLTDLEGTVQFPVMNLYFCRYCTCRNVVLDDPYLVRVGPAFPFDIGEGLTSGQAPLRSSI
jgi:hypothetical protein